MAWLDSSQEVLIFGSCIKCLSQAHKYFHMSYTSIEKKHKTVWIAERHPLAVQWLK